MGSRTNLVLLDLNSPTFQRHLFALTKEQQRGVLLTLAKISEMTWDQVYKDPGIRWEAIAHRAGPGGQRSYSLRMGKGFRAIAYREGERVRFLSLHPDHHSAYE